MLPLTIAALRRGVRLRAFPEGALTLGTGGIVAPCCIHTMPDRRDHYGATSTPPHAAPPSLRCVVCGVWGVAHYALHITDNT